MNQNKNSEFVPDSMLMSQQTLHLSDCLNIIWKRKWWAIAIFVAVVAIVTVKNFITTPIYEAKTNLLIGKQYSNEHTIEGVMSRGEMTQEYYQTQSRLLESHSLINDVIKELGLGRDRAAVEGGERDMVMSTSHLFEMVHWDMPDLFDWYLSNLKVEQDMGSQLISISFSSPYPEIAVLVANTHAGVFIARSIQKQSQEYKQAIGWLDTQLEEQRIKLQESERAVVKYQEAHSLLYFKEDENTVSNKLDELNAMIFQIDTDRLKKQATYDQLENFSLDKEEYLFLPEIEQNTIIDKLRNHLVELKTERMRLDSLYGYKHPEMIDINARIKNLEQEIFDEVKRVRGAIKSEMNRLVSSKNSIKKELEELEKVAKNYGELSVEYNELIRQRESDKQIYDSLLLQSNEKSVLSNTKRSNISVADKAVLPRYPIRPKKAVNISIAVALGFVCGVGLAFFIEYVDRSVRTPEDVASRLGLQVVGMLPYDQALTQNKRLALASNETEQGDVSDREGYYYNTSSSLISGFPVKRSGMDGQTLLIESTLPGDGKSTVVAKSAVSLARGGLRVVMVDTDHQRSTLHSMFGVTDSVDIGLLNIMRGIVSMDILSGNLEKCSLDDLFYLISLKSLSGQLVVSNDSQTMAAIFKNGQLFHIMNKDAPPANRLGTTLLRADLITEEQLKDALERSQRAEQPLGYILVNLGYINQDQLQGPLKLQMEEHLQMLFSWNQGTYSFEQGDLELYEDKKIHFQENYAPVIKRLGRRLESRFLASEILSNVKSLDEPNLSIIPAGLENDQKVEGPVYYALVEKLLDILKQRYDVVLIDAPPLLNTGGIVKPLLRMVDGVIFVVKSGKVSVKQVNEAKSMLNESGINVIGTILNQVMPGKDNYGNYYKNN
ncbi:MAG: DUF4388 domain-containing protein [Candidatus Scalindua sp. AMX11]|nr:MAG: DUF4388 domain-containing protein [Candidatus Scalindua sp.]NOG82978.1 DUF4388 domain-containing protein [Planctomycetota bacterium]RZV68048.1 MAG: DUF4388 domain-containing protein [Candidatus Scalindua sp. SCAELEC01]TDE63740.1 MAG: DUF4388 domain-containing protein [Candidatus Scalindua sp. AMX11]GJQ60477.1 MAG: hypothetical protein SCALA701_32780 [Candidatus Scalindua sp.]